MSNMFTTAIIDTARLRLEPFAPIHAVRLNAINNEPDVMRFLSDGAYEPLKDTQDAIARVRSRWIRLGFGWWAIIDQSNKQVIGAVCAQHIANVEGAEIEIGWRLTKAATGHGYATEAGEAAARYAFDIIGVDHVVATADLDNLASHHVMQRLGMTFRGIENHYDMPCTTYVLQKPDLPTAA